MNGNVVVGVIGLSIFGAGFGVGYLVSKKRLEKKYAAIAQEEIDSVKERFVCEKKSEIRYPQDIEGVDFSDEEDEEESDPDHDPNKDYTDDPFEGMSKDEIEDAREHHRKVVTDYTKYYHAKPSLAEVAAQKITQHTVEEDEEEEYEDAETDEEREIREGEALGRVDHTYPYVIEPEQYDTECEHYDKIDLFYYAKDDTLIDENDIPVDDMDDYLDAISKLQMQTNVYVRDERIGADYALHRLNRSYKEDVLGIAETPREREFRHLARRKTIMDGEE